MITAPEVSLVSISEIRGVLHPYRGAKRDFYSLLSTLWCRKWTTKRVASFQLNVSPGKTQAKTAMNARRTTSFFFSSKLLCNSNGERKRAILFELLGWKVYPSLLPSFSMRFHSLNNFVDFCFNERRRSYTVFLGRNRMNFSDGWIFFDISSFLVYPFAQFVDKCFRYTWYRWLFFCAEEKLYSILMRIIPSVFD